MAISPSLPLRRTGTAGPAAAPYVARHGRPDPRARRAGSGAGRLHRRNLVVASAGALGAALHLGLFAILQHTFGVPQTANLVALLLATLVKRGLHEGWTFGLTGAKQAVRRQLEGAAVFGLTVAMSAGALWLLSYSVESPSAQALITVVGLSMAAWTLIRFMAIRAWIIRLQN